MTGESKAEVQASNVGIAVHEGQVLVRFDWPLDLIKLDPQNAYHIGEAIARAAHEARFGEKMQTDASYIAQQVRARITEAMRDRLVQRLSLIVHSMRLENKSDGEIAMTVVDRVLSDAT